MVNEIKISQDKLIRMYTTMVRIRQFEDRVYLLFLEGEMPGTIPPLSGRGGSSSRCLCQLKKG